MKLLNNKKTIILDQQEGVAQQEFLFTKPLINAPFLPAGIHLEDIDSGFLDYVQNGLEIVVNENKVRAILLSTQKFSEFMRTWESTDQQTESISLPIITIVRNPIAEQGTNFDKVSYNIPYDQQYTIYRIPKTINGKSSYEYYQIPQPINVDLKYEINFFATKQRDINKLNELMLKQYQSSQRYIDIGGHYMGSYLTGVADDSKTQIEARRFYRSKYSITLKGYLLDEKDFKAISFYDKVNISTELNYENKKCVTVTASDFGECNSCLNFNFPRKTEELEKEYKIPFNLTILSHNKSSLTGITLFKNDSVVTIPFDLVVGDRLKIVVELELVERKNLSLSLCGNKND